MKTALATLPEIRVSKIGQLGRIPRPALPVAFGLAFALVCCEAPPVLALGCGILFAEALARGVLGRGTGNASAFAATTSHRLLAASIVALGCGLDLRVVLASAQEGAVLAALTIVSTFALGLPLARRLGVAERPALLVLAGTAICGGSAIAAAAPALRARPEETAASLGIVFALNGVALLVFPWIGTVLCLDAEAFGTWCALAIHDTSAVVGAAATHSDEALDIAAPQKLSRALWIVPVASLLAWHCRRSGPSGTPTTERLPPKVPHFLLLFVLASAVVSFAPSLQPTGQALADAAPSGMVAALFFAGLSMSPRALRSVGWKALWLGATVWVVLAVGSLTLLLAD